MMSLVLLLAVAAAVPVVMAAQPLPVEERTWMTTLRQAPPETRAKAVLAKMRNLNMCVCVVFVCVCTCLDACIVLY
eukprot:COSAG06_NODE_3405_length_5390_cov_1.770176_3_plen_76_part_00